MLDDIDSNVESDSMTIHSIEGAGAPSTLENLSSPLSNNSVLLTLPAIAELRQSGPADADLEPHSSGPHLTTNERFDQHRLSPATHSRIQEHMNASSSSLHDAGEPSSFHSPHAEATTLNYDPFEDHGGVFDMHDNIDAQDDHGQPYNTSSGMPLNASTHLPASTVVLDPHLSGQIATEFKLSEDAPDHIKAIHARLLTQCTHMTIISELQDDHREFDQYIEYMISKVHWVEVARSKSRKWNLPHLVPKKKLYFQLMYKYGSSPGVGHDKRTACIRALQNRNCWLAWANVLLMKS
jgi:hypothetical protein